MNNLIDFILGGETVFSAVVAIRFFVFVLTLDFLSLIAYYVSKMGGGK